MSVDDVNITFMNVDDLAFAHVFRGGLADTDNHDVTALDHLADDGAHLRCADLETDDDLILCPHEIPSAQFENATGTPRVTVRSTLCTILCRCAAQVRIALNRRSCWP